MTRQVLGVTGRYCAGKDTLVRGLVARGFAEVDVDRVGHDVLADRSAAVVDRFGEQVRSSDGSVDRARLGKIVFSDRRALHDLEAILHPPMIARVEQQVRSSNGPIVINAAVLHKMGLHRLCDRVVCVTAPFLIRLHRARIRDGVSMFQALRRLTAQRGICPKWAREAVDTIIVGNAGSPHELLTCLGNIIPDLDSV